MYVPTCTKISKKGLSNDTEVLHQNKKERTMVTFSTRNK